MTQEAYVSFDVAKLLKEKGFDEPCFKFYTQQEVLGDWQYHPRSNKESFLVHKYSAPTQQMTMRWLREVHKMYVCIDIKCFMPHLGEIDGYSACIWYKPENNEGICCYWACPPKQQEAWDTYEAAAEAAVKYCLENLIKED